MFKFSLRQLMRQKGRTALFFLLLAASTALVVTGAVMTIESAQRIDFVESTYTTIGMVEQQPIDYKSLEAEDSCNGHRVWSREVYADPLQMEALDFPGADYIVKPEQRPVFLSYLPELDYSWGRALPRHIVEFTPLEDTDGIEPVEVRVTRVLHSSVEGGQSNARGDGSEDKTMEVGDTFIMAQHWNDRVKVPLKTGERYVANLLLDGICQTHQRQEYSPYIRPFTGQYGSDGKKLDDSGFYSGAGEENAGEVRIHRVTGEDFYEPGHMGDIYMKWAEIHKMENHMFPALGASGLEALPSFHNKSCVIAEGREITRQEFAEGSPVCLVPQNTARANHLSVGDKVKLSFSCVSYGFDGSFYYDFPMLDADGEFYDVFFEQEYEIVGLYAGNTDSISISNYNKDLDVDMLIIPISSVTAGWEGNIAQWCVPTKYQATFQIPNGSISRFDEALRESVPEAAGLSVTYDDRGYTEVMKSLRNSRSMAYLLLLGGVLAAAAMIALLLYFFVVKEKKRTAIERSLGMSRAQCRVSLLGGLAVLTAVSVAVGAVLGAAALSAVQSEPPPSAQAAEEPAPEELDAQYRFSTQYSLWAEGRELAQGVKIEAEAPAAVYLAAPVLMCLVVGLLAWLLLERSFRTDPIYLLSTRENR